MDTKALEYYMVIYETRSVHRAAEKLFMTQQGLSGQLRSLEKEFGTLFFQRTPRGLIPTPAGDCFYREAIRLRQELTALRREVRDLSAGKKEITLACSYGSMHVLHEGIRQFSGSHPDISVHWAEYTDAEVDRQLADQKADLAFLVEGSTEAAPPSLNLELRHIFSRRIMVLVYRGHPYFDRESLEIRDLKGEELILEGKQFHIYSEIVDACIAEGFYPNIRAETAEINLCNTLCRQKEGLGIVVDVVSDLYRQDDVHAIPLAENSMAWNVAIARNKKVPMRDSVQAFWDFIAQSVFP